MKECMEMKNNANTSCATQGTTLNGLYVSVLILCVKNYISYQFKLRTGFSKSNDCNNDDDDMFGAVQAIYY